MKSGRLRPWEWALLLGVSGWAIVLLTVYGLSTVGISERRGLLERQIERRLLFAGDEVGIRLRLHTPPPPAGPAAPRPQLDVVLALDHSGSMGGGPGSWLDQAREAAQRFVQLLDLGEHRAAVAPFDGAAAVTQGLTSDGALLASAIAAIGSGGGTAIDRGVQAAHQELVGSARRPSAHGLIVLLTDGQSDPAAALAAADAAKGAGLRLLIIGLGDGVAHPLLEQMASAGGDFYTSRGPAELERIYADIAVEIADPAALDVRWKETFDRERLQLVPPPPAGSGGPLQWTQSVVSRRGAERRYTVRSGSWGWFPVSPQPGGVTLQTLQGQQLQEQAPTGPRLVVLPPLWLLLAPLALALLYGLWRALPWLLRRLPQRRSTPGIGGALPPGAPAPPMPAGAPPAGALPLLPAAPPPAPGLLPTLVVAIGAPWDTALVRIKDAALDLGRGAMPPQLRLLHLALGAPRAGDPQAGWGDAALSDDERFALPGDTPAALPRGGRRPPRRRQEHAAFVAAAGGFAARLTDALRRLQGSAPEAPLRVWLIGALGGEGSGLLCEAGWRVRRAAAGLGQECVVYGVFALPTQAERHALAEGEPFAALREIERCQFHSAALPARMGDGALADRPLFDHVFLASADHAPLEALAARIASVVLVAADAAAGPELARQWSSLGQHIVAPEPGAAELAVSEIGAFAALLPMRDLVQGAQLRFVRHLLLQRLAKTDEPLAEPAAQQALDELAPLLQAQGESLYAALVEGRRRGWDNAVRQQAAEAAAAADPAERPENRFAQGVRTHVAAMLARPRFDGGTGQGSREIAAQFLTLLLEQLRDGVRALHAYRAEAAIGRTLAAHAAYEQAAQRLAEELGAGAAPAGGPTLARLLGALDARRRAIEQRMALRSLAPNVRCITTRRETDRSLPLDEWLYERWLADQTAAALPRLSWVIDPAGRPQVVVRGVTERVIAGDTDDAALLDALQEMAAALAPDIWNLTVMDEFSSHLGVLDEEIQNMLLWMLPALSYNHLMATMRWVGSWCASSQDH